ncbi:MAG: hypothetical protein MN733_18090 [Nitrososphaera sp.]|nr:hypothetical protein [Nitrososphaera sp.]
MAFSAFQGSFNITTAAAGNTVAVTGVGFQPKAIIFWYSGRTESVDTVGRISHQRGVGFAVSATDRRSAATQSEDASAAADTAQTLRNAACIATITIAGAIDGLGDLQSMDSDGFTIVIDDAFASDVSVSYLALGGADLTDVATGSFAKPTITGSQSITSLPFQPDFVMFAANKFTSENAIGADSKLSIGMATGPANEGVWAGASNSNDLTTTTKSYATDVESIAILAAGGDTIASRAEFTQFTATGFDINWLEADTAADIVYFLALKGGKYRVDSLLTQTDTTTDIVETGFGFQPKAGLFLSHGKAKSTQDTLQDDDEWSIGAFHSTTARGAQGVMDQNAAADSVVSAAIEFDEIYVNLTTAGALEGLMDIKSIDTDGFTAIMDDADPAQAFVLYAAFGDAAGGVSIPVGGLSLMGVGR